MWNPSAWAHERWRLEHAAILARSLSDFGWESSTAVLEELDLAQPLLRLLERLVGSAEVLSLGRQDLVAFFCFLDHDRLAWQFS